MSYEFDFDSGELCLDFANTSEWHASQHPEERLHSYDDLAAWGEASGILSARQAETLRSQATRQPARADAAYRQAIALREAIYRLFSAISDGEQADSSDLALLNAVLERSLQHLQVVPSAGSFAWEWNDEQALERVLWPVARSAAELLVSENLDQVHECEDDRGCGSLFIDTSRNHSRRWCSMESCGNRAKARRHYARQKEQDD